MTTTKNDYKTSLREFLSFYGDIWQHLWDKILDKQERQEENIDARNKKTEQLV